MNSPEIVSLLGRRDLETAIVCLSSLQHFAKTPFRLTLIDDSTLRQEDVERIESAIDVHRIVSREDREQIVMDGLRRYPNCREFREQNVLAQKLFDPYFVTGDKLIQYIDSDILFLRPFFGFPVIEDSSCPIFMADMQSAYAVTPFQLFIDGTLKLPKAINTGLIVFPKSKFDLETLERFLEKYSKAGPFDKTACWAEQTCWALLVGDKACKVWNPAKLIIASPQSLSSLSSEVLGIHFVSSYRSLLGEFLSFKAPVLNDYAVIDTVSTRSLGAFEFALERLGKKLVHAFAR